MILCGIDAIENRYIVCMDIPGYSLHVDMKGIVHMVLEGKIAKLIAQLRITLYRKYIWQNKKGKPML